MTKLTDKQERFVSEYLIDLNATQAAIRAGYSEHTAKDIGSQNLAKLYIAEAISKAMDEVKERNKVTVDEITGMHRKAFDMAEEKENPAVMTTSGNNLAKLHGLIVDKQEQVGDFVVNIHGELADV